MRLLVAAVLSLAAGAAFATPQGMPQGAAGRGPSPNAQAYAHANESARFQREGAPGQIYGPRHGQQERDGRGVPTQMIDTNRDGFISREELQAFRQRMEQQRAERHAQHQERREERRGERQERHNGRH